MQVIPEVVDMLLPTHDSHPPYTSQSKPPSALLGPALVMRVLAENGRFHGHADLVLALTR